MGGIPCRLFFASGRLNHGWCPRPVPTVVPLPFTSYLDESEVVAKRRTWAPGGEISRVLFVFLSALCGESPAQGYGQSIRASSVEYVQFIARNVGYAVMS